MSSACTCRACTCRAAQNVDLKTQPPVFTRKRIPQELFELVFMAAGAMDPKVFLVLPAVCREWKSICSQMTNVHLQLNWSCVRSDVAPLTRDPRAVTTKTVETLLAKYGAVSTLDLSGCRGVTKIGTHACFRRYGRAIKTLRLGWCLNVSPKTLTTLAQNLPGLERLDLRRQFRLVSSKLKGGGVGTFPTFPKLRALNADTSSLSDKDLATVAKNSPHLSSLRVPFCASVTGAGLLASVRALHTLDISGCRVSPAELVKIAEHAQMLQVLDAAQSSAVTALSLAALAALGALRRLNISRCAGVDAAALATLAGAPLEALDVSRCLQVRNLALGAIAQIAGLRRLNVTNCPITIADLGVLSVLPALAGLETSALFDMKPGPHPPARRTGVIKGFFPWVKRLRLSGCMYLLEDENIAAEMLKSFPEVTHLDVSGCAVARDYSRAHNIFDGIGRELRKLKSINITHCDVAAVTMQWFLMCQPGMESVVVDQQFPLEAFTQDVPHVKFIRKYR